jgi:hypothetical protein
LADAKADVFDFKPALIVDEMILEVICYFRLCFDAVAAMEKHRRYCYCYK